MLVRGTLETKGTARQRGDLPFSQPQQCSHSFQVGRYEDQEKSDGGEPKYHGVQREADKVWTKNAKCRSMLRVISEIVRNSVLMPTPKSLNDFFFFPKGQP